MGHIRFNVFLILSAYLTQTVFSTVFNHSTGTTDSSSTTINDTPTANAATTTTTATTAATATTETASKICQWVKAADQISNTLGAIYIASDCGYEGKSQILQV
jgi:hypothetical protein